MTVECLDKEPKCLIATEVLGAEVVGSEVVGSEGAKTRILFDLITLEIFNAFSCFPTTASKTFRSN